MRSNNRSIFRTVSVVVAISGLIAACGGGGGSDPYY